MKKYIAVLVVVFIVVFIGYYFLTNYIPNNYLLAFTVAAIITFMTFLVFRLTKK